MSEIKTKPSSNAIIFYNKKLLLFLRDNDSSIPDPNRWALVGGEIDKGETFTQAMKREIKEEISILPKSIQYLGKIKTPDGNPHFIFLIKMVKEEVEKIKIGSEGQQVKFFKINEVRKLNLATHVKKYFEMYGKYLEHWLNSNSPIEPEKLGLS